MLGKVKWRKLKNYSGPLIKGTEPFHLSEDADHWERVIWLTAQVETGGKFGATVAYDGTGNTSGIIQAIAVYPRELAHEDNNPADDQGPLWRLLDKIFALNMFAVDALKEEIEDTGWYLKGGILRWIDTGHIVPGKDIRDELTPINGKVPRFGASWAQAKEWALLFHNVFVHPDTYDSQISFGIHHAQQVAKRKPKALKGTTVEELLYKGSLTQWSRLCIPDDPLDLALAVFFSNSVNAPAIAFRRLWMATQAFKRDRGQLMNALKPLHREIMARMLIRSLGTSSYGRWNFRNPKGRYQRTRRAAMKVWPSHLFIGSKAVMPKKL